jgi:hypothetical protein
MRSADEYAQWAEDGLSGGNAETDRVLAALDIGEALVYAVLAVASAIKNRPLP